MDWRQRHVSHLWSYHLHYFDYARDLAWAFRETGDARFRDEFVQLASSWIEGTAGVRSDGWEPYALSSRIVNWMIALLLLDEAIPAEQRERLWASVHQQLRTLERRIEWHLLANHLQRNLQALAMGALVFGGKDADRWMRKWMPALWRQVEEQILPDGTHFERSPMYHAAAFSDLLETTCLAQAAGVTVPQVVLSRLREMGAATGVLFRPNGEPHLFNDCATRCAPSIQYLERLSKLVLETGIARPSGLMALPYAGYYGMCEPQRSNELGDRLLVDCGEPGPSYQPGHAHCDLLSFELDVAGTAFVTDSGVRGYAGDPWREYVRSTRAHNTVSVGGREQHEIWDVFRMARRARVGRASQEFRDDRYLFRGSYQPYHSARVHHHREIALVRHGAAREYTVTDMIEGAQGESVHSYLHLHPQVLVESRGQRFIARLGASIVEIEFFGVDTVEIANGVETPRKQGWYCPEFGRAIAAPCFVATVRANFERPFGYRLRVMPT